MTDSDDYTGWQKLPEFAGVDLTKSFILSWHAETSTVLVDVDLFLNPDHSSYEKPRPAEKVCIRPAIIEFPYCESISVNATATAGSLEDLVSTLSVGAIEGLQRSNDGAYEIRGSFGQVKIDSERAVLKLRGP